MRNHAKWVIRIGCIGFALWMCHSAKLMGEQPITMAHSFGAGTASVSSLHDPWQSFHNPAQLSSLSQRRLAFMYQNRFFSKDIHLSGLQYQRPTPWMDLGLGCNYLGYDTYQETTFTLSMAKNLGPWYLGASIDLHAVFNEARNEWDRVPFAELGVLVPLNPQACLGAHVWNIWGAEASKESHITLPVVLSLGTEMMCSSTCGLNLEFRQDSEEELSGAVGLWYQPYQNIKLKLGSYYQEYIIPTLGLGLKLRAMELDLGVEWHPVLGVSSGLVLGFKV